MKVMILATKDCSHRPILEKQLKAMQIPHSVQYFEEQPNLSEKYNIHLSPNIVVDEMLVFRATPDKRLPGESELQQYFDK